MSTKVLREEILDAFMRAHLEIYRAQLLTERLKTNFPQEMPDGKPNPYLYVFNYDGGWRPVLSSQDFRLLLDKFDQMTRLIIELPELPVKEE